MTGVVGRGASGPAGKAPSPARAPNGSGCRLSPSLEAWPSFFPLMRAFNHWDREAHAYSRGQEKDRGEVMRSAGGSDFIAECGAERTLLKAGRFSAVDVFGKNGSVNYKSTARA